MHRFRNLTGVKIHGKCSENKPGRYEKMHEKTRSGKDCVRMEPWDKRASSGNVGEAKCDHTNVKVGDAGKGRGRWVVKPVKV